MPDYVPDPPPEPELEDSQKTFKKRLMEKGVWPQYAAHLRELKQMMAPAKAKRVALEKFLGKDFLASETLTEEEKNDFEGENEGVYASRRSPPAKYVNMKVFEGKTCTEIEAIRWVASNVGMFGVKARDCPSAMAWNLLNQCRSDEDFMRTFWGSMFVKAIPAKDKREGVPEEGEIDGQEQVDMCERALQMSEEARNG